ncbi:mannose P dolichol utilization defect 1 protein [Echinococcus multilocularis]|uniref:Solute carrier family 66 member 3 n=1 Tax=Echinococcus multilocularis TaxID=6211 RepID=A0A068Y8N6_ECHMU|nr:mannose P dolichol utilization defect 1 protein [Echinococcus multilocularis]
MEGVVVGVLSFLMPEDCVTKYVKDNDFLNVDCFKMLVSKCLGYGIVAGSTLVLKTGSANGLSIAAGLLELLCYTGTSSYSFYRKFPFSTYGDATFLLVQSAIISFLTISWEISYLYGITFLSSYVCFAAYTLSPAVELSLLTLMQAANTPIILFSRGLQIYANFRNGSTGQLSAISVWLMAAGSLARIFTSIQETGDMLVILNFVVGSFVNIVLSAQIIYYWNCPLPEKKMAENKKTN